jgi:hypothetical protein
VNAAVNQVAQATGPKRVTLGKFLPVKAYQYRGATIRPNAHSAKWRRMWWVTDAPYVVLERLRAERGIEAAYAYEPISFPSLRAACSAIDKAGA